MMRLKDEERIISLEPKGWGGCQPRKYFLVREDEFCWYGIPVDNPSVGETILPKFVLNKT